MVLHAPNRYGSQLDRSRIQGHEEVRLPSIYILTVHFFKFGFYSSARKRIQNFDDGMR